MSETVLIALVGSLAGLLGALTGLYGGMRKADADARRSRAEIRHIDIDALQDVIAGLGNEIKRMQERLAHRDTTLNEVRRRVDVLSEELALTKVENVSLRHENELLKDRVKELEDENKRLECEILTLRHELEQLRQSYADRG